VTVAPVIPLPSPEEPPQRPHGRSGSPPRWSWRRLATVTGIDRAHSVRFTRASPALHARRSTRYRLGLSLVDAARLTDTTPRLVWAWEEGTGTLPAESFERYDALVRERIRPAT
jgi:hypothetical protein